MQFTNVFLATAYFFFTVTPMVARAQCTPDFGGRRMRLYDGESGVIGAPNWPDAWYIQPNGASNVFKDANDNNRALTRNGNGSLGMAQASESGNDPNQLFNIVCDTCNPDNASGCMIQTFENRFVCVSVVSEQPESAMRTLPCNPGAPFQTFEFEAV